MNSRKTSGEARFSYEGLDRVIHERARLSILTSLLTHRSGLGFVELKQLCGLTDGNLARHLQVLEAEGMVRCSKQQEASRTQTLCEISVAGRERYVEYLQTLEQVVRDAARASTKAERRTPAPLHPEKA